MRVYDIYVYMIYMFICYICLYVYLYICMYAYTHICTYVYMYICIYVYMYICIYVYMKHVYMYICIYVYMYVHSIFTYIQMYICTCCVTAWYRWCDKCAHLTERNDVDVVRPVKLEVVYNTQSNPCRQPGSACFLARNARRVVCVREMVLSSESHTGD